MVARGLLRIDHLPSCCDLTTPRWVITLVTILASTVTTSEAVTEEETLRLALGVIQLNKSAAAMWSLLVNMKPTFPNASQSL